MDLDTPETRAISWLVPYVAIAMGVLDIVVLVVLVFSSTSIFPERIDDALVSGIGSTSQPTAAAARAQLAPIRERALEAFATNGVPRAAVAEGPVEVERDAQYKTYSASQSLTIQADDYPRFARFANRINRLKDADIGVSFPHAPFQRLITGALIVFLIVALVSTVALETRKADVNRSPKGMHPLMVAVQTLMYGVVATMAIVYAHFLGDGIAGMFAVLEAIFCVTLAVWLYQTRRSWAQSTGYRLGYCAYMVALALVVGIAIWAFAQPMV